MEPIELFVPFQRDKDGWWDNPAIPDFDEDYAAYKKWKEDQGIETAYTFLESEDPSHPSYIAYYENEDPQVRDWNPEPPVNDPARGLNGRWCTFLISDTEDGPVWVWARRIQN